ncbi:hypothetical protein QR680_016616 [Steinernema hermaphroditum]|uniref:Uncharacterized protein n=1 Tax=Steinernema hermaphroditum TaxID=289476 RepID=A0AA39HCW2_9BILA|nr:hypothetical protein QR680_016616 [Steinernema hermaphroditum]
MVDKARRMATTDDASHAVKRANHVLSALIYMFGTTDVTTLFARVKVTHLEVNVKLDDTAMKLVKTLVANRSLKNVSISESLHEDQYITAILPLLLQPQRQKFLEKVNTDKILEKYSKEALKSEEKN